VGLAVLGPHASGDAEWPDVVTDRQGASAPAPTRYMLLKKHGLVVHPALSVAYSVTPELHLGASFVWGIANFEFQNITSSIAPTQEDWSHDITAKLTAKDMFVPGFLFGALWEAHPRVDL